MRKEIEKLLKREFGSIDPVVIGRKTRWAVGRALIKKLKFILKF